MLIALAHCSLAQRAEMRVRLRAVVGLMSVEAKEAARPGSDAETLRAMGIGQ